MEGRQRVVGTLLASLLICIAVWVLTATVARVSIVSPLALTAGFVAFVPAYLAISLSARRVATAEEEVPGFSKEPQSIDTIREIERVAQSVADRLVEELRGIREALIAEKGLLGDLAGLIASVSDVLPEQLQEPFRELSEALRKGDPREIRDKIEVALGVLEDFKSGEQPSH